MMPGIDPNMIAQLLSSMPGAASGGAPQKSMADNPPIMASQPPGPLGLGSGFDNFVSQWTGDETAMHPLLRLLKHTNVKVAGPGFGMSVGQQGNDRGVLMRRIMDQIGQGAGGTGVDEPNDEIITTPGTSADAYFWAMYESIAASETTGTYKGQDSGYELRFNFKYEYS